MTDDPQMPHDLQERVLAGRLLTLGAGSASSTLDNFSGWLIAGFGATFGLIFGNLDAIAKLLPVETIRSATFLFFCALFLGVIQKMIAAIVTSGTAVVPEANAIGRQLAEDDIEVNFTIVFSQMQNATMYPARLIVNHMFNKLLAGDFAAAGRMNASLAQIQALLVFLEVLFCLTAGILLASRLGI